MLIAALLLCAGLGLAFTVAALRAWRDRRRLGALLAFLSAALFLTLAALCGTITIGIRGYQALAHEVVAATIQTEPIGPQRFRATVTLPDGRLAMFDLAGDGVYVDAHILKWRPIANFFGLHTAYELDRIAGRYDALGDERGRERTVHSLAVGKPVNVFYLARRYRVLRLLVDAEYGSATFIGARTPAAYEVRVSTTGLLVRGVPRR